MEAEAKKSQVKNSPLTAPHSHVAASAIRERACGSVVINSTGKQGSHYQKGYLLQHIKGLLFLINHK